MNAETQTIESLLDSIAERSPTPGGGAVAGYTSALAASLASMVVAYSKPAETPHTSDSELERSHDRFIRARRRSLDLAEEDQRAYSQLNELWKKPKDDPTRIEAWDDAVAAAIEAPCQLIDLALEILVSLEALLPEANRHMMSDLAIAAAMAETSIRSAAWNVRINLPLMSDLEQAQQHTALLHSRLEQASTRLLLIESACRAAS